MLNFSVYLKHVSLAASGGRDQEGVASKSKRVCAGEARGGGALRQGGGVVGGGGGLGGLSVWLCARISQLSSLPPLEKAGERAGL